MHALTIAIGKKLGVSPPEAWLFFKYPRTTLEKRMDRRPKDWKQSGWEPRFEPEDRVLSCILYHSWCWPVGLEYAVQLAATCPRVGRVDEDDDELLRDQMKQFIPLRAGDIARIINDNPGSVSRAVKRLLDRKDLTLDDAGRFSPAAALAECTIAERRALYAQQLMAVDPSLRGVPKVLRPALIRIQEECPPGDSTAIFEGVRKACTAFRSSLGDIRSELVTGIKDACTPALILIPDLWMNLRSSSSQSAPSSNAPPPSQGTDNDDERGSLNELYAAGLAKGALAKLPPHEERPGALIAAELGKIDPNVDGNAVDRFVNACRKVAADCTASEMAVGIQIKAKIAAKKDNPVGFLITAVPNLFADGGLAKIRERLKAGAEESDRGALRAKEREDEVAAETALIQEADAAWNALPEAEKAARCKAAESELRADKQWKLLTAEQRKARIEPKAFHTLRDELAAGRRKSKGAAQ